MDYTLDWTLITSKLTITVSIIQLGLWNNLTRILPHLNHTNDWQGNK